MTLLEIKLKAIHDTLTRHRANKTKAAKELGITVKSLRNWVLRYDALKDFRVSRGDWLRMRKARERRDKKIP